MRESYSYFQTPFRNAQVNRDSQVFGDLESRVSAAAPTLFSLGGDPLPSQKFSRKYLTRHKKSGQLWRRAVRITPGGVESNVRYFKPHPFLADYGDGGYIYDVDGNKILDLMMGFGALLLGHNNRDIALEVIKQLESGSMLGVTSELYIDYIQATAAILEENEDEVGALIIEPVLCGPGVIAPKANYLRRLRQLTRKKGIVLIFDEVLTGFRLAYGGAQEYYDIRPDMTTFGKIAGGGFQLAGFGGEAQIMNVLEPGRGWKYATFHAGTYNGHPISVAAGLKGLEILGAHGRRHRMGPRGRRQRVRGDRKGSPAAQGKGADGPAAGRRRAGGRVRRCSDATERGEDVPNRLRTDRIS